MRSITMMQSQWKLEEQSGQALYFEGCKGGYFSDIEEYGLKVIGKTGQNRLSGKNLFNYASASNRGVLDDVGNIYDTNTRVFSDFISVTPSAIYTFKTSAKTSAGTEILNNRIVLYNQDKNYVRRDSSFALTKEFSFTVPEGIYFVVLDFRTIELTEALSKDMLNGNTQFEAGSTATEYEPFCGGIPSPNPDYPQEIQCVKAGTEVICGECEITTPCDLYEGDIWYPMSGKVVKNNEVIMFDGTEAWRCLTNPDGIKYLEIYNTALYPLPYANSPTYTKTNQKCNMMGIGNGYTESDYSNYLICAYKTGNTTIRATIPNENFTAEEVSRYFADLYANNTPMILLYKLATPTIEQYEPQPIFAPCGTVNLTQQAAELEADLSATMLIRKNKEV